MANLADIVKKNSQLLKRGTSLFEAAPESLANQVNKQGLAPGAAVSPGAAAGLGATADQAKMAGSAAQVEKATRESVRPSRQLGAVPERMVQSEEEAKTAQRAEELGKLEGLGTRISGLVRGYIAQEANKVKPAAAVTFETNKLKNDYPSLTDTQIKKVESAITGGAPDVELFQIFGISPTDAQAAEKLNTALSKYKQTEGAAVIANITASLGPDITLGQLKPEDFEALGLTGLGDLTSLLGMEEGTDLSSMTVDELQSKISTLMNQDFDKVDSLSRIANDAFYPANVRADAQRQLRDLSSVGVQATEADMQKLNEEIQSADVIMVGNEEMTVQELLSDEGLTEVITAYLDDKTGEYQKLISGQFPELEAFIKKNKNALTDAAKTLDTSVKSLANVQKENAKLASYGPVDLTDFNKVVYGPGYDPAKPINTAYTPTPAYNILTDSTNGLTDEQRTDYAAFLKEMAKANPNQAKEYANMSLAEVNAKIPAGMSWSDYFKGTVTRQKYIDLAKDTTPVNRQVVAELLGGEQNYASANQYLKDALLMSTFNIGAPLSEDTKTLMRLLDVNQDGVMDTEESVKKAIQRHYGASVDLKTIDIPTLISKVKSEVSSRTGDALYKAVQDGNLSPSELEGVIAGGMNPSTLYDLLQAKQKLVTIEEGGLSSVDKIAEAGLIKSLGNNVDPNLLSMDSAKLQASAKEFRNKPVEELDKEIAKYREYQNNLTKHAVSTPTSKAIKADMMRLVADQIARLQGMYGAIADKQQADKAAAAGLVNKAVEKASVEKQGGQAKNLFRPSKWRL